MLVTSSYFCPLNFISQSPRRAILAGSFIYGVQFPSWKGHLSSEPSGLLDRLKNSHVSGAGGPPFQLPASCLQGSGSFKGQGASGLQHCLSDTNLLLNHILWNNLSTCVCPCAGKSGHSRKICEVRARWRNLSQPPIISHPPDWDTGEVSFWFHSLWLLSSSSVFTEPIDLVILGSLNTCYI